MYNLRMLHVTIHIIFNILQSEAFFLSPRDYRLLLRRFLDPQPNLRRLSDGKSQALNDRRQQYGSQEIMNREALRKYNLNEDHCRHHYQPYEYDANKELRQNYNKYIEHDGYHRGLHSHGNYRTFDHDRRENHEKCYHYKGDYHRGHLHSDPYTHDDDYRNRRGYQVEKGIHGSRDNPSRHSTEYDKYKHSEHVANNHNKGEISTRNSYNDPYDEDTRRSRDKSSHESVNIPELIREQLKDLDKKIAKDYVSGILVVVPKVFEEKNLDADINQNRIYESSERPYHSINQETYPDLFRDYFLKNYSQSNAA